MDDASTHRPALEGAYGVFVVTNDWEHFSIEKGKHQAKSITDAVVSVGVKHIIWSTLEGTNEFFDSLPEIKANARKSCTKDNTSATSSSLLKRLLISTHHSILAASLALE